MMNELKNAIPGKIIRDRGEVGSIPGLFARATQDGRIMFYLRYRTRAGQIRSPKIGQLGPITLAEARKRAKLLLERVFVGEDPKGQWDAEKGELTVSDLFEQCFKKHWSAPNFTRSGWAREVRYLYLNHIKTQLGSLKLSELTPGKIRLWHADYMLTPYAGNRALSVLGKMFAYAEEVELRPQNSNPCHLVKYHPEKKRKRYATPEEVARIFSILDAKIEKSPNAVAFIYLLIFTGSRPRAIERATWDQIEEVTVEGRTFGILTFHGKSSSKTGEDEKVVLPPQAMRIITRLPRVPGKTITGILNPLKFWTKVREEAGCPDLWSRDFRRLFATTGMSGGISKDIVGALLNHKDSNTTDLYAKLTNTAHLAAVGAIADALESIGKPKLTLVVK